MKLDSYLLIYVAKYNCHMDWDITVSELWTFLPSTKLQGVPRLSEMPICQLIARNSGQSEQLIPSRG